METKVIDVQLSEDQPYFYNTWNNRGMFERVYSLLQDDMSRGIMRALLSCRLDEEKMEELGQYYTENQYFGTGLLKVTEEEIFVDAGAYLGDSIEGFRDMVKDKFKKIYAFEASPSTFSLLQKNALAKDARIRLHHLALGAAKGEVSFSENRDIPYCNKVDSKGSVRVGMDKLDNLIDGHEATFVKMDIEGAELDAILGAEQLIKKSKPKLAISVYHLFEDIWQLPMLIHSYVPEYKFYMRYHHGSGPFEIILYAVL